MIYGLTHIQNDTGDGLTMSWEIITGLIVLFGAIVSIGTIVYKLSNILTKLESAVDNLRETLATFNNNNSQDHDRIFDMIDKIDRRLTILETKFGFDYDDHEPAR